MDVHHIPRALPWADISLPLWGDLIQIVIILPKLELLINYEERFLETAHSGGYHHPDGHRNQPRNGLLHGLIVIAIWLMCVG